ncbi:MAG: SDR family NAD(P)-dependent oxidoreductase [Myxococcota bacterium]
MARLRFSDQVVWITGASSGIGRALALELAAQGAHVALSARRVERLEEVASSIKAGGQKALVVPCDVTDEEAVMRTVEEIVAHFGRLDVAIANSGFGVSGRVESLHAADWRRQLETNVVGLAITARYALPHLRRTRGRLALTGSAMGMFAAPGFGAYSASKYAVRAIGQTLAMELYGSGVSCTLLEPGYVESEIGQVDSRGRFHPEARDRRPQRLMWPADRAARVMVRAIDRRQRECVLTGHGKVGAFFGRHAPWLVHWVVTRLTTRR